MMPDPVTAACRAWIRLAAGEYCFANWRGHLSPGQHRVARGVLHSLLFPADIFLPVMAGQLPPSGEPPKDDTPPPPIDSGAGMAAVSYLIGGMIVWGGIGWLVDHHFHTHGIAFGIGAVVGAAAGVYLVARRFGA
jgi:ATP synthase protein I